MGWEPCLGWGRLLSCAPSPAGTLSKWIKSDQKGHMGASADHLGFNTSPEIVLTTLKAHQSVPKNILGSQSSAVPRQLFTFASSLIPSCPPRGRNTGFSRGWSGGPGNPGPKLEPHCGMEPHLGVHAHSLGRQTALPAHFPWKDAYQHLPRPVSKQPEGPGVRGSRGHTGARAGGWPGTSDGGSG